jgi:hypothetical protein
MAELAKIKFSLTELLVLSCKFYSPPSASPENPSLEPLMIRFGCIFDGLELP